MLGACACCKLVRKHTHRAGLPPLLPPPPPARPCPLGVSHSCSTRLSDHLVNSKTLAQHRKPACYSGSCRRRQCTSKLAQAKVPVCCQQLSAPSDLPFSLSRPEIAD